MKQKTIVLIILIFIATASSVVVLASDGYLSRRKSESKILAVEERAVSTPIVLAQNTSSDTKPTIVKTATVKKAPAKKVTPKKKKVVKKKSKLNLAPAVFTPETAPYSAKKR